MRRLSLAFLLSLAIGSIWAGSAQAVVLYEQMTPLEEPPTSNGSNQFTVQEPGGFDTQLAEDFTVPAGQTWTISQVDVAGRFFGSQLLPPTLNVFIYANDPTDPGDHVPLDPPLFQQLDVVASNGPNYVIPLSGAPPLGPGKYWVSVQQTGAFYDPNLQESNSWSWRALELDDPSIGSQSAMKFFPPATFCLTWTPIHGCQDVGTRNFAFRLHGPDAVPAAPVTPVTPAEPAAKKKTKCKKKNRVRKRGKCVKRKKAKRMDPRFTG